MGECNDMYTHPNLPWEILAAIIANCPAKFIGLSSSATAEALRAIDRMLDRVTVYAYFGALSSWRGISNSTIEAIRASGRARAAIYRNGAYVVRRTISQKSDDYEQLLGYAKRECNPFAKSKVTAMCMRQGTYIKHYLYEIVLAPLYFARSDFSDNNNGYVSGGAIVCSDSCTINTNLGEMTYIQVFTGKVYMIVDASGVKLSQNSGDPREPDWAATAKILVDLPSRLTLDPVIIERINAALEWILVLNACA